jgi:hypothetical protein
VHLPTIPETDPETAYAYDDPVKLACAARIIRGALARGGIEIADLRSPDEEPPEPATDRQEP